MWLREYIFNALIPVIHLLIYAIFVGSAAEFAESNPIYALVCIGFLIPAEKFIRKMFGFDKATTVSPLGAAAGGALVMNAINHIKKGGGGDNKSESGTGSSKVRTANSGYIPAPGTKPGNKPGEGTGGGNPSGGNPGGGNPSGGSQDGGNSGGGNPSGGSQDGGNSGGTTKVFGEDVATKQKGPKGSAKGRLAGLTAVGKKYINKQNIKRAAKTTGRKFRRKAIGAAGAAALGTIGLAAGLTTGDLSKVGQYTAAAGAVGYASANRIGDKLTDVEKQNRETYKENKWGTDEYETRQAIQDMENNPEFLKTAKEMGLNKKERATLVRQYRDNGIVDSNKMINAMNTQQRINNTIKKNGSHKQFGDHEIKDEEIIAAQRLSQGLGSSYWSNPENRDKFRQRLIDKGVPDPDRAIALISQLKGDLS